MSKAVFGSVCLGELFRISSAYYFSFNNEFAISLENVTSPRDLLFYKPIKMFLVRTNRIVVFKEPIALTRV